MRISCEQIGSSDPESQRKSKAKHSEGQDVPQLAHLLYAFSPTAAIFGLSPEYRKGCKTKQMKAIAPNSHPSKGNGNCNNDEDELAHDRILL
jgi:hypothetical protein